MQICLQNPITRHQTIHALFVHISASPALEKKTENFRRLTFTGKTSKLEYSVQKYIYLGPRDAWQVAAEY